MFSKNIKFVFLMAGLLILPLEVAHLTSVPSHFRWITGASGLPEVEPRYEEPVLPVASVGESVKKAANVSARHIHCVATAIYWEAAHEPFLGQIAVARVIMNRVAHGFGSNPCAVVYQTSTQVVGGEQLKVCQFSWHCEGKDQPKNNANYQRAVNIATQVLEENKWWELIPNNVLFFHNNTVNPRWQHRRVMTIGNHTFYATGREKKQAQQNEGRR